jgi:AraC-like DNA-binding protein
MNLTLANIFFIVSISQLLLISVFLFTHKKGKKISNSLLGAFFFSISLNLIDTFLQFNHYYKSVPFLAFWGSCLPLLFGPFLYYYVQSLVYKDFVFSWKRWKHLLPFAIFFIFTEATYLSSPASFQHALLNNLQLRRGPEYLPWTASLIFLHFLLYAVASLRLIRKYRTEANQKFSDPFDNNRASISSAIICFMVLMTLAAVNQLTLLTSFSGYFYAIFSVLLLLVFLFISEILLKTMRRPELFSIVDEIPQGHQSSTLGLDDGEKKRLLVMLKEHMARSKPYLEPQLTLEQLATQLSIRPKILSYIINNALQQNFFDFVNRYRIEEARQLLTDNPDKKLTVLEVLYKVGFNSKSSFNTLFKKYTGLTPSEFKKKV